MVATAGKNNLLQTIWFQPRTTLRQHLLASGEDERLVFVLSLLYGATLFAPEVRNDAWATPSPQWALVALGSAFLGLLGVIVGGGLLSWTGSWMGGRATFVPARAAIALASLPRLVFWCLWLPVPFLFGAGLYESGFWAGRAILYVYGIIQLIADIWTLGLFLILVSEVHEFSVGRALLAAILVVVVLWMPLLACGALSGITERLFNF